MANPINELFKRRVPQIVGLYLVGCWGFVEFTDWAVEQYVLSPHVTNFVVILLISLLPSVVLLAWRFGAPGDDQWTRTESVAIPLNVIASAAILFFTFTGKDLGAATTTVMVEDEAGNEIEREIPKQEFRKRAALFSFDNASGDTALDWMSYGIPLAIQMDLAQQLFVLVATGTDQDGFIHDLREAGFDDGVGVPLTLKQDVAERRHLDYFLSGSFTTDATGYTLEYELYETRRAKSLARQSFSGTDLFALVDQMSEQLRRDLDIPAYRIEESTDLSVSELTTTSIPAFRSMSLAMHSFAGGNVPGAVPLLERAVEADPTFAWAQMLLGISYLLSNRPEDGKVAMDAARQHLYRLPERYQLAFRSTSQLLFEQDGAKAFETTKYWSELYPDDIDAHRSLANLYLARGERSEAIAELEIILELDPTQSNHIRTIGNLYAAQAEYDKALEYHGRYRDEFPDDYRSYTSLAGVYRSMGDHDRARDAYERALVVEPDETGILGQLAGLERDLGNFERAAELRDQALAVSRSPQDRYWVYGIDETLHYRQGQYRALGEDYRRRKEIGAEFLDPVNRLLRLANSEYLWWAVEAGNEAGALRELDRLSAQVSPPFDDLLAIAYLVIYQDLEDAEKTRDQVERLQTVIATFGFEAMRSVVYMGIGRLAQMDGDCEEAIANYNKVLEINPNDVTMRLWVSRCQLELGDPEAAEASLLEVLRIIPALPDANYQLGLVYEEMGRADEAIAQLEAAVEIWKNADPEYIPAQQARSKLAELQSTS